MKRVILCRLMGGLGNQMFQYAYSRALAIRNHAEVVLDTSLLAEETTFTKRNFELDVFNNIVYRLAAPFEVFLYNGDPKANFLQRLRRVFLNLFSKRKLILQEANKILPEYLKADGNICVVGRWQSYLFFEEYQEIIVREFLIEKPVGLFLDDIVEQIEITESVCLHVRRGDLVTIPIYNQEIGVLGIPYYQQAVDELKTRVIDATFFVFSDDIAWCKENLRFAAKTIFVDEKYAGEKALGHFFLMQQCKNFILSNSTFAWWTAYLSKSPEKIVFYPKQWNQDSALANPQMCPPSWIAL